MKRLVVFGLVTIALVAVTFYFTQPPVVIVSSSSVEVSSTDSKAYRTKSTSAAQHELQELQTFRGATANGTLRTDHRGNLVIDMQLRH